MSVDRKAPLLTKIIFAGVCLVGVWLVVTWLLSAPASEASGVLPELMFQSPIPPVDDPDLTLVKSVDNDAPSPGDEITYTLVYSTVNPGSEVYNVRLYDFLPDGVTFQSANPTYSYNDGVVLFTDPSAGPVNETATVRVRVERGYVQLRNHAMVMADYRYPVHDSLLTSVEQPALRLEIDKFGPSAVLTGTDLVYELRCENASHSTVNDVTVADVLPGGLPLVGASPPPDDVTPPVIRWSVGDLAPAETWEAVITVTAPASVGTLANTALVDGQQSVMTQTIFTTEVVTNATILNVSKSASAAEVDVGDELVYTLRYENTGSVTATNVVLTDILPSDVTVIGVSPAETERPSQRLVWKFGGTLSPSHSGKVVFTVTVGGNGGRWLSNVANITGQPGSFPGHAERRTWVRIAKLYLPVVMRGYSTGD